MVIDMNIEEAKIKKAKAEMEIARMLRWLLIPLWFAIFIAYLPIWYLQMSWYYFSFSDYWDSYMVLWDRIMLFLKLKKE